MRSMLLAALRHVGLGVAVLAVPTLALTAVLRAAGHQSDPLLGWLALPLSLLVGVVLLLLAGALLLFRPSDPTHPVLERVATPLLALSVAALGVLFLAVSFAGPLGAPL